MPLWPAAGFVFIRGERTPGDIPTFSFNYEILSGAMNFKMDVYNQLVQ